MGFGVFLKKLENIGLHPISIIETAISITNFLTLLVTRDLFCGFDKRLTINIRNFSV